MRREQQFAMPMRLESSSSAMSSPLKQRCTEPVVLSLHHHSPQHDQHGAPIISVRHSSPLRPPHCNNIPTMKRMTASSRLFLVCLLVCGISCSYANEPPRRLHRNSQADPDSSAAKGNSNPVALLRGRSNNHVPRIAEIAQIQQKSESRGVNHKSNDERMLSFGRRSDPDENKDPQQQEGQQQGDGAPAPYTLEAGGGNTYGTYGTYMSNGGGSGEGGASSSYGNAESGAGDQQSGGTSEGSGYGTYGTATGTDAGGGESSYSTPGTYGSYGGSSAASTSAAGGYGSSNSYSSGSSYGAGGTSYGGSSSSYGSGSTYGSSSYGSGSSYGTSSYGSGSSYGSTYDSGGGYSSTWGATSGADSWGTAPEAKKSKFLGPFHGALDVKISLLSSLLLLVFISLMGMLLTAHKMEHDPEGNYANCCRVLLNTVNCIYKVIYNLYHCRLGDIPQVVFASELEEDEYTDEELEQMRLRPGIERALDVEHRKALRKVGIEMNKIKVTPTMKSGVKNGGGVQR